MFILYTHSSLEENEQEIEKLYNWLNKIEKKDYFNCEFRQNTMAKLKNCENMLHEFSNKVYERDDI